MEKVEPNKFSEVPNCTHESTDTFHGSSVALEKHKNVTILSQVLVFKGTLFSLIALLICGAIKISSGSVSHTESTA